VLHIMYVALLKSIKISFLNYKQLTNQSYTFIWQIYDFGRYLSFKFYAQEILIEKLFCVLVME